MHDHPQEPTNAAAWWEARYASGATTWSGKPNDLLVGEAAALVPGRALDLGCGTGGDAIWLASLGWHVTAVDIAAVALEQAATHAAAAGVDERITWERHDFDDTFPAGEFDLVTACYLQSPVAFQRLAALRAGAEAVAPGGTLVIISHEHSPSGAHGGADSLSPDALLAELALPGDAWSTETAKTVDRQRTMADGCEVRYRDSVIRLRRR